MAFYITIKSIIFDIADCHVLVFPFAKKGIFSYASDLMQMPRTPVCLDICGMIFCLTSVKNEKQPGNQVLHKQCDPLGRK